MEIKGDKVIFSSGKQKYANGGRIGLSPDLDVTEGYDGGFYNAEMNKSDWIDESEILSGDDLCELADFMIEQWQKFKAIHANKESGNG